MKKKPGKGELWEFDRGPLNDCGYIQGYVLDYSDDWSLLQVVDRDIFFNGYCVIRNNTIERFRKLNDHKSMAHRALQKLGQFPVKLGEMDLADINAIVQSAIRHFPLLVFHREIRWKDECEIGGIALLTPRTITITSINPGGEYGGLYRLRSEDITMVGFDGHYERALWAVASERTRKRITTRPIAAAPSGNVTATARERHAIFIDSLQTMLQATETDLVSVTIEFPSALDPEGLDRPMLARFLALLLRQTILKNGGVLSLGTSIQEKNSSLSYSIGGKTHAMSESRPPWRVAAAIIEELSVAAGLSQESTSGTIRIQLHDGEMVLQVEEKNEAGLSSLAISKNEQTLQKTGKPNKGVVLTGDPLRGSSAANP